MIHSKKKDKSLFFMGKTMNECIPETVSYPEGSLSSDLLNNLLEDEGALLGCYYPHGAEVQEVHQKCFHDVPKDEKSKVKRIRTQN